MRLIKCAPGAASKPPTTARNPKDDAVQWTDVAAARKTTHPAQSLAKRFLDIPELAENILEFPSAKDLLRVESTCQVRRARMALNSRRSTDTAPGHPQCHPHVSRHPRDPMAASSTRSGSDDMRACYL